MNKISIFIVSLTFGVGAAIGWIARSSFESGNPDDAKEITSTKKMRIADSKNRVKAVTTVVTNVVHHTVTNSTRIENGRPNGPAGFMADLERMKTENPERYTAMTNRMAQFRNRMMQRSENKLETLSSIDTAGWSKKQIEIHEKYQDLIARRAELMDIVRHDGNASQEERNAAFSELRNLGKELHEVSAKERNTLLDKTFQELGYDKSDAAEIRETVKTIFTTTEEWGGPHGHHGRRHGGNRPPR
jgi:hypothetical protein